MRAGNEGWAEKLQNIEPEYLASLRNNWEDWAFTYSLSLLALIFIHELVLLSFR